MTFDERTKVHELIEAHPYLLDWLAGYAPEFAKLRNPVLYNTVARVATLEAAAAMADTPVATFLDDIGTEIARREIMAQESQSGASTLSHDDRAARQEQLKAIIGRLHAGADVAEVKAEFNALTHDIDATEIAQMEQALIAEGMPVEEVQRLCDVHVSVFKEALDASSAAAPGPSLPPGHPVSAYLRENEVAAAIVIEARRALEDESLPALRGAIARLAGIATHYVRKENQLFPVLERHSVEGPTKVMWALDDDIRGRIKTAAVLADTGDMASLRSALPEILTMVDDMIYKEEKILFPTALQVITEEEWAQIAAGDAEIGYAWTDETGLGATITPAPEPQTSPEPESHAVPSTAAEALLLPLPTGALSLEQLDVMFRTLPFDLSYVDEDDRVRFYSEGERVFPRSPGAIGRDVHNCHPPASVHKVIEILDAFKAGTKDTAEFWIEMGTRFIHIRYFAMRDADGAYKGCLEVVQDATHVRALEGQRRLVNW